MKKSLLRTVRFPHHRYASFGIGAPNIMHYTNPKKGFRYQTFDSLSHFSILTVQEAAALLNEASTERPLVAEDLLHFTDRHALTAKKLLERGVVLNPGPSGFFLPETALLQEAMSNSMIAAAICEHLVRSGMTRETFDHQSLMFLNDFQQRRFSDAVARHWTSAERAVFAESLEGQLLAKTASSLIKI